MNRLKVLIRDGDFLWKPSQTESGHLKIEGPYCLDCRVELREVWWKSEDEPGKYDSCATCVQCKKEIQLGSSLNIEVSGNFFPDLKKDLELKLASKNLREYKVVSLDDLPEKEKTKEHYN